MAANPTAGAARPVRPPANPPRDMNSIVNNIPNLFAMDRDGRLQPNQAIQLRSLIASQARLISLRSALKNENPNPLLKLPDHLNPTISSPRPGGGDPLPALIPPEEFAAHVQTGIDEAARVSNLVIPLPQLSKMLKDTPEKRQADLAADPVLRTRFNYSVAWFTKNAEGFTMKDGRAIPSLPNSSNNTAHRNNGANTTSPAGTPGPSTVPSGTITAVRPTASSSAISKLDTEEKPTLSDLANLSTIATTANVKTEETNSMLLPGRTSAAAGPMPVQTYVEPEDKRRKRKFTEWLKEMGPGMEFEVGVEDVWSEVLDGFVLEAARGAAKLAKHRKSDRVGVRDLALFLDTTYGISVPGYNAHVPERVHLAPEARDRDNRSRKAVAPNAARLARARAAAAAAASGVKGKEEDE